MMAYLLLQYNISGSPSAVSRKVNARVTSYMYPVRAAVNHALHLNVILTLQVLGLCFDPSMSIRPGRKGFGACHSIRRWLSEP